MRIPLLVAWLAVLGLAAGWLTMHLKPATDLTAFLPAQASAEHAMLLDELRDGATTRLILIAIEGADSEVLAAASKQFATSLQSRSELRRIDNGQRGDDDRLLSLALAQRYLLTPNDVSQRLSEQGLHTALRARLRDLGSAMEMAVKDLLPVDPTHETLAVLDNWRPSNEPSRRHGVWFDASGRRALLVAETVAPGFDLDGQAAIVTALQTTFDRELRQSAAAELSLLMTGPGPFGVRLRDTTQFEAQLFSTVAVAVLLLLLWLIYRSVPLLLYGGLPLASGMLAALLSVQLLFGGIHGITLAFGATLLGVAIDYPLHLFSHRSAAESAVQGVRQIWPTLRLGVLSTCIAYLTLLLSDFPGLAQLGLFTVVGLLVAAASTRWLLPRLLDRPRQDVAQGMALHWQRCLRQVRLPTYLLGLLVAAAVMVLAIGYKGLWQNDLAALTPVSAELQQADSELRQALGAAELRHLLLVEAGDQETVLQRCEQLATELQPLIEQGQLRGLDQPARYLPSLASQQARQSAIPEPATLRRNLAVASAGMPFRDKLFEPFLADAAAARRATPVTAGTYEGTFIAGQLNALLKPFAKGWRALLPLQGVEDVDVVNTAIKGWPGVRLVDLKSESEAMVARFRGETLSRIGLAFLAIAMLAAWGLPRRRWLNVLMPVLATVLVEAALFRLAGIQLTLFHLISLMLVGGIVLDYALFFNRDVPDEKQQTRTLHAISVCCVSTLTVFGILALSEIPVLRAIGVTVAAGVLIGYLLSALTAVGEARLQPDDNASTKTQ